MNKVSLEIAEDKPEAIYVQRWSAIFDSTSEALLGPSHRVSFLHDTVLRRHA